VHLKDLQITSPAECQLVFEYVPSDLYQILHSHRLAGTQLLMETLAH
jgi:hypothetical protein